MADIALPRLRVRFATPLVLLLGTGLRLTGLAAESIWLDEATSILLGRAGLLELVRLTAQDIHPPFYYSLLHLWLYLGEGEFVVRSLSAVIGVVSIAVIYQLGRKLFDEKTGLIAAMLLAVSPLHIWYSQETRMYALVTLLTLGGGYCLWQALQRQDAGRQNAAVHWIAYVACMALALYTHYHALFVLLFQNGFFLLWWLLTSRSRRLFAGWLLAQISVFLLFSPWIPVVWNQIARGGGSWVEKTIGNPSLRSLPETWIEYSIGNAHRWYPVWLRRLGYLLFAGTLALAFMGGMRAWRRREGWGAYLFAGLYLGLSLGAVWAISQVKPMYAQRYLLPFLPPYLLLLAAGIRALPARAWRLVLAESLAVLCLVGAGLNAYYPQKDDWRGVVRYVLQEARAQDVVVFDPLWNYKPFDYYAQGRVALYRELPVPISEKADIGSLLGEALTDYERLWLIWSPGHYADPTGRVQAYLDARYPLALRGDFGGVGRVSLYDLWR